MLLRDCEKLVCVSRSDKNVSNSVEQERRGFFKAGRLFLDCGQGILFAICNLPHISNIDTFFNPKI